MTNVPDLKSIGIAELAHLTGRPVQTIYHWRKHRKGPKGFRAGRSVRFLLSDVRAWIDAQPDVVARSASRVSS